MHGLVSQEIWNITWIIIAELVGMEQEVSKGMNRARMELIRRLLVYVSRYYRYMIPRLKGVYLMLESWRPYRDKEG